MENKTILIHVKSNEALNNYIELSKDGDYEKHTHSKEIKTMIKEFMDNNWTCFLASIENFDLNTGIHHKVYCLNNHKSYDMTIDDLNNKIPIMIIRNIGPLEKNFNTIKNYLQFIINNYQGIALNNPQAMIKGMAKNYLVEINPKELEQFSILTIPTRIYPTSVTFKEIESIYKGQLKKYLIKPLSGELSNSLNCLANVNESFFRMKENKVQGWIIQPIQEEIWNGEYQMVFLDGKLIYSQSKHYLHSSSNIPNQKNRIIAKYHPNEEEIQNMQRLIKYFESLYNTHIDICRIDFMKNSELKPILLEFEMVNPGFFILYMDNNDNDVINIVQSIRKYCEEKIK